MSKCPVSAVIGAWSATEAPCRSTPNIAQAGERAHPLGHGSSAHALGKATMLSPITDVRRHGIGRCGVARLS